jgi:hypothetical protein
MDPVVNNRTPPVAPEYTHVFGFEQSFVHQDKRQWMTENWHTSIYWSLLYVALVFGGQVSIIRFTSCL